MRHQLIGSWAHSPLQADRPLLYSTTVASTSLAAAASAALLLMARIPIFLSLSRSPSFARPLVRWALATYAACYRRVATSTSRTTGTRPMRMRLSPFEGFLAAASAAMVAATTWLLASEARCEEAAATALDRPAGEILVMQSELLQAVMSSKRSPELVQAFAREFVQLVDRRVSLLEGELEGTIGGLRPPSSGKVRSVPPQPTLPTAKDQPDAVVLQFDDEEPDDNFKRAQTRARALLNELRRAVSEGAQAIAETQTKLVSANNQAVREHAEKLRRAFVELKGASAGEVEDIDARDLDFSKDHPDIPSDPDERLPDKSEENSGAEDDIVSTAVAKARALSSGKKSGDDDDDTDEDDDDND